MRWLALCLTLLAAPALATQDRWPALFDVTGVATDDVLNIRRTPAADGELLGSFPADARDIEVLRPDDRETWGMVNLGDTTGWVSLSYLARQPGQWYGSAPERSYCSGTEPFWSLTRDGEGAIYATPDGPLQTGRVDSVSRSQNHPGRHALTLIFSRDEGGKYLDGVLLLSNQSCTDGMSDRAYGFRADVILGNIEGFDLLSGCCSLQR